MTPLPFLLKSRLTFADRDPEAEAEDKVEEEKLPGVDEEGPAAIESGFQQAGGDWDTTAPAAGFAGAAPAASNWDGAGEDWAAAGAAPPTTTTEWAEPAKDTTW